MCTHVAETMRTSRDGEGVKLFIPVRPHSLEKQIRNSTIFCFYVASLMLVEIFIKKSGY